MAGESATDSETFTHVFHAPYQISGEFKDYFTQDVESTRFLHHIIDFLENSFFPSISLKVKRIQLQVFHFPGENYSEPELEIIFQNSPVFNRSGLTHEFNLQFRNFLIEKSPTADEFIKFRQIRRKTRISFLLENWKWTLKSFSRSRVKSRAKIRQN